MSRSPARGSAESSPSLSEWLLQLPFHATAAGPLLADRGGCLLLGVAWLAVAVALWTAYAAPSRFVLSRA